MAHYLQSKNTSLIERPMVLAIAQAGCSVELYFPFSSKPKVSHLTPTCFASTPRVIPRTARSS